MEPVARYQVGMLGASRKISGVLERTLRERLSELGVSSDSILLLLGADVKRRDSKLPFVLVYFGLAEPSEIDVKLLDELLPDSPIVLPVVNDFEAANIHLPESIRPINALLYSLDDRFLERLTGLLLQQFRLLRRDRRVFISYRRKEADVAAAQLYDALDGSGFDVFLDTRGVPPGEDFQDVLWHRMADSDVIVVLDTPGFADSRWTVAELSRANATNIQILQVLWPDVLPQARTSLSHFERLKTSSFLRPRSLPRSPLHKTVVKRICTVVESLRARAMAARHRFLVDSLCDLARMKGINAIVHPDRTVLVKGATRSAVMVPLVGVPSSLHLEEEFISAGKSAGGKAIYVIYDERGLLRRYRTHLGWLNASLPIRSIGVFEVARVLDEVAS